MDTHRCVHRRAPCHIPTWLPWASAMPVLSLCGLCPMTHSKHILRCLCDLTPWAPAGALCCSHFGEDLLAWLLAEWIRPAAVLRKVQYVWQTHKRGNVYVCTRTCKEHVTVGGGS